MMLLCYLVTNFPLSIHPLPFLNTVMLRLLLLRVSCVTCRVVGLFSTVIFYSDFFQLLTVSRYGIGFR